MKSPGPLLTAMALFAYSATVFAQTAPANAQLLVHTDLNCRLIVDGKPRGELRVGDGLRLSLTPGEHHLEAVPVAGGPRWEENVRLTGQEDPPITVLLHQAVANAEAERSGYWIAPDRRLMWAAADNGSGVTFQQAAYYCRFLALGGHRDWTLPSIDELRNLFGGDADEYGHHVNGPAKLTGWTWSASEGREPGEHWALDFGDGGRASVVDGDSGLNRALCVRPLK